MSKRILLVEDDIDIRRNLKDILESEGYECSEAANGREALHFLRSAQNLPGLILLDLMMPVMDGFQFKASQELDPILRSIPVVVMTADNQVEAKSRQMGAEDYVRKPVELSELLDKVERLTGSDFYTVI